uniref:tRNA dimethylallyltransferase n=1 Tax=Salix viminalis TaxID=40686 RepID=A0A6N2NER0_SALVM
MIMTEVCGLRTRCLHLLLRSSSCRHGRQFATTTTCSIPVPNKKDKIIVISGPTGTGKTRLALELAKRLNGEIVSADSVQVYRGLDVGSAKPTASERKEVRHHLVDILHPSEDYSVGQFYEDARQATQDILKSGRVPIVTGGTGLYLRWFIYGKPDVPKASPEVALEVYSELAELERNKDWDAAVQLVVKAGDSQAQFLAANDWYRLRRSLEIIKTSGSPPSAFQVPYKSFKDQCDTRLTDSSHDVNSSGDIPNQVKLKDLDYEFICFFLSSPRLDLYRSIDYRCEDMLAESNGVLTEAKWLLDEGLLPNSNSATRAIGYRQAMEYLLRCREDGGRTSAGEFYAFLSEFQKASRNFAKRQMTWFRNEHIYHWLDASKPLEKVLSCVHDAYNDQTGSFVVPESLRMKKDMTSKRDALQLKAYRTKNRHFVSRNDCSDILDWIRTTQGEAMSAV